MRLKCHNVKYQKIRAFINHEAMVCSVIFAMMAALVLGIAKRHSSVILSSIGIVFLVLAGASFVFYRKSLPGRGLFDTLNLTTEQKKKIKLVIADQSAKFVELHKDHSLSLADRRERAKSIYDGRNAKLKEILTSDQYAKYQDMWTKMMPQRPPIVSGNTAAKPDAKQN